MKFNMHIKDLKTEVHGTSKRFRRYLDSRIFVSGRPDFLTTNLVDRLHPYKLPFISIIFLCIFYCLWYLSSSNKFIRKGWFFKNFEIKNFLLNFLSKTANPIQNKR